MPPRDAQSLRHDLSAFADGELDAAAARQLMQRLIDEPAAADELVALQKLTTAARRAVLAQTPQPSDALRERIASMVRDLDATPAVAGRIGNGVVAWFKRGIAAAVLLAVGVGVGQWAGSRGTTAVVASGPSTLTSSDIVPASIIAQAEEIHGFCSRLALGLHSGGYPTAVAALADPVKKDLHSDHPWPDLTSIGYAYRGAGPCGRPLADSAHLLYRSLRPGSVAAVSVFVQPWHGQYAIAADRLYTVSIAQSPFPMLAWRSDQVVYFLIADNEAVEQQAVDLIRGR